MDFPFVIPADVALLILRLSVGAVFIGHGWLKRGLWSAKEKKPMDGTFKLLSVVEPLGGLGLVFGVLTPWAAAGLILVMLGALYYNVFVWKKPFSAVPSGWEFDLLLIASCLALIAFGPGAYALLP